MGARSSKHSTVLPDACWQSIRTRGRRCSPDISSAKSTFRAKRPRSTCKSIAVMWSCSGSGHSGVASHLARCASSSTLRYTPACRRQLRRPAGERFRGFRLQAEERATMRLISTALLYLLLAATPSGAQAPAVNSPTVDALISLERAGAPTISPDGKWVAYTMRETNWDEKAYETEIWIAD